MNLAARISRLERQQASASACGTCVHVGPVVREISMAGNAAPQEPDKPPPATFPACGRRREVTSIVIHLPDDGEREP